MSDLRQRAEEFLSDEHMGRHLDHTDCLEELLKEVAAEAQLDALAAALVEIEETRLTQPAALAVNAVQVLTRRVLALEPMR